MKNKSELYFGKANVISTTRNMLLHPVSLRARFSTIAILLGGACLSSQAHAQAITPNLVSACSGVSLPPSAVTGIIAPVIDGVVAPVQNSVNPILGFLGGLPGVPGLNIDTTTLLANAAAGAPITLQVLNANGAVVGPADRCDLQADSFGLTTPRGISIGGNRIDGLGANGLNASAGEAGSIAFGNSAATDATAVGSIALGSGATTGANANGAIALGTGARSTVPNSIAVGAGSLAARGATSGYNAPGLTASQTSAGELSVGTAGAERQITNVAAGSAPTDAVNVAQLSGVADSAVLYDTTAKNSVTLAGASGTRLTNVSPATLNPTSTDAVNGSQLFATNTQVTNNANAVTNLTNNVANGALGTVQYSNAATPTVPNGGTPTNDLTLVGAATGGVGLHNVRDGAVAAGSTDAVNGGQIFALGTQIGTLNGLAVQYDDATRSRVTLGGSGAAAVGLGNVAAGTLAVGSTDAVNGGQIVALGNSVAGALGGTSSYDSTTNSVATNLAYGGATYTSVQAAFDAVDGAVNGGAGIRYFRVQSTRGDAIVSATDSIAIGPEANASAANSVALGTGAAAVRGANTGYAATGLLTPQTSIGEVSVGSAGGERQITNLAAGSAPTDAVNVAQLSGVADQISALGSTAVQYDGIDKGIVTLGGAGGTTITNLKAGAVTAASTDAVNGSQLAATNATVANTMTAITTLTTNVANGATGPVRYSNAADPTVPNGGIPTNDLALVGAAAAPVALHNVANGKITAGSTDAINGGQIYGLAFTTVNAVSYDADAVGNRTNTVTLAGGDAAAPVTVRNVADGTVAAGSTEAVNGGQLAATNQAVTAAQTTASTALSLGQTSVQYDSASRTEVTLGSAGNGASAGAPVSVHNVAAGTSANDAVNVAQLNTGINSAVTQSRAYTDSRLQAITYDLRKVRRDSNAGTAGALAAAGLPQAYESGKGMIALAGGTYQGQSAFALGFSKAMNDGHTVVKLSGTYDTQGRTGGAAGVGYQF